MVVAEAARALASFTSDPQGLVTACRRLVSRQPGSAPLVWLCARVLTAGDPRAEIREALDELEGDRTSTEVAHALPEEATVLVLGWPEFATEALPRRGDLEVLVADVLSEGSGLVQRLLQADVDAIDVPITGLGAAAAEADVVCSRPRPSPPRSSSPSAAPGPPPRWPVTRAPRCGWSPVSVGSCPSGCGSRSASGC